jgi:hypothetical protein
LLTTTEQRYTYLFQSPETFHQTNHDANYTRC